MAIIAAFWTTPILLIYYGKLTKLPIGTLGKLIIDQLIFSPIFTTSVVGLRIILMGRTPYHKVPEILFQLVPSAVLSSWSFWMPARAFSLMFIPVHMHIVSVSALSFIWNMIFSMLMKKSE